jgi:hypothetical protein
VDGRKEESWKRAKTETLRLITYYQTLHPKRGLLNGTEMQYQSDLGIVMISGCEICH